jgi:isopentenyl-diphosphate Delta-isomerase
MNMLDSVVLVDDNDHQIGVMDKYEAHRNGAQLHRAVSVYLFSQVNGEWQLLIQKRSAQKIVGATMWANTICGNVRPGESYRECAYRRLREELGLKNNIIDSCDLHAVHKFSYFVQCNEEFSEREIDQVFIGFVDAENHSKFEKALNPNAGEVAEIDWISYKDLVKTATENNWQPNIDHFLDELLQEKNEAQAAPWFIIMLRDEELVKSISQLIQNHV